MQIPKIIHQTWKTKNIPYRIFPKAWVESWKIMNPSWSYRLWTDHDARELVKECYPQYLNLFDGYSKPIQRADALRYFVLHKFGGLYVDLDFLCLKSIDPILQGYGLVFGRMGEDFEFSHSIPNALMGSVPGSAFWLEVVEEMERRKDGVQVEYTTGPILLRDVILKHCPPNVSEQVIHGERLKVWEGRFLYPINWKEASIHVGTKFPKKIDEFKKIYPDAYAVTLWTHSWGPRDFWIEFKQFVWKILKRGYAIWPR